MFSTSQISYSISVRGLVFPEVELLNLEHIPGSEEFRDMGWVRLGRLLDCINGKARIMPRISVDDIFSKYACLSDLDNGGCGMVWFSSMEYCIRENRTPIERRAEIFILEEWARKIDRIVTCQSFLDRLEREEREVRKAQEAPLQPVV